MNIHPRMNIYTIARPPPAYPMIVFTRVTPAAVADTTNRYCSLAVTGTLSPVVEHGKNVSIGIIPVKPVAVQETPGMGLNVTLVDDAVYKSKLSVVVVPIRASATVV